MTLMTLRQIQCCVAEIYALLIHLVDAEFLWLHILSDAIH